ncbi:hypothetical protein [Sphingomonas sp. Ag1]|uniref:hypothetical protein n=1 Tax=Sphingomonas sp. Ag1 TaxID=1642949 RepID=UPI0012E06DB1|nr:hypothetical protein [Sphingomonas sp. Ag1]
MTRIHAAIRRIEAAMDSREQQTETLRKRHAALRGEVAQAVAAIDALVAAQDATDQDSTGNAAPEGDR